MKPTVAFSSDFFTSVLNLPRTQQEKARRFVQNFCCNPRSPGINYEMIKVARDKKLRSVRIDQAYRAIILAPSSGNIYILLWVGKHDEAYNWARNKVLKINPENGALQFINSEVLEEAKNIDSSRPGAHLGLFHSIKDRQLIRIGVPKELIPLVREITTPLDLEGLSLKLPEDSYESLALLADGESLEEVLSVYGTPSTNEIVDVKNFVKALEHPQTKRRFLVSSDDDAMRNMLDAPLARWRVFLHPSQRRLIFRDWRGPIRVLGGAGTGKTVVAMHRAKWMAEGLLKNTKNKVLFTTYTSNLAIDIEQNLRGFCSIDVMNRIEVINLDSWVKDFLYKQDINVKIISNAKEKKRFWDRALRLKDNNIKLPITFYYEEWEKVVQPQNISTLCNYLKVRRIGRGVRLNHSMRKAVWPVFERFRFELDRAGLKEIEDVYRDAHRIITENHIRLPYHTVVLDEAQDFGLNAFKLVRAIVPEHTNDLFIVGDPRQRIYGNKVVLGHCGIKIVGRSRKLRVNYRTTEQIRKTAVKLLGGLEFDDLDNGQDDQKGYRSLLIGEEPLIQCFNDCTGELDFIVNALQTLDEDERNKSCIALRRIIDIDRYSMALAKAGIRYHRIDPNASGEAKSNGVRLATMHRVKGLEFDYMFVACVNELIVPLNVINTKDPAVIRDNDQRERSLLYVSITRAKRYCSISGFGKLSRYLTAD